MARKRITENDLVVSGSAAAAPVRRKSPAKPRAKHTGAQTETAPAPESIALEVPVIEVVELEASAVTVSEPSREEIALQAYLYWEARGFQGGSAEEDWLRAEHELRARTGSAAA
ncbi:MAG TPA: DUF2934 domain-containing protein [Bryobacteraceae bacterium]|jgi:hypothetical protein